MRQPHGNALLTWAQVEEIVGLRGLLSSRVVGELFNIKHNTVLDIWRGRTWKEK